MAVRKCCYSINLSCCLNKKREIFYIYIFTRKWSGNKNESVRTFLSFQPFCVLKAYPIFRRTLLSFFNWMSALNLEIIIYSCSGCQIQSVFIFCLKISLNLQKSITWKSFCIFSGHFNGKMMYVAG